MEERIIDDEFGRGVRMKKTKDGYVLADENEEGELLDNTDATEESEEVTFEFPTFEEELEEDWIGLSPEEVAKRRAEREAEQAKLQAEYDELCAKGDEFLSAKEYKNAEIEYGKALKLLDEHTNASVGFWRAKTEDFAKPQVLVEEYEDAGVENLEFDLGAEAVDILKKDYREVFEREYNALVEEETPLRAEFEEKQGKRRDFLKERLKKSTIWFVLSLIPLVAFAVLTAVFGGKIQTTPDGRYIAPTIAFGLLAVAGFIAFIVMMNGFFNSLRLYTKNERTDSTDMGARLVEIEMHKELYELFLEEETEENA